MQIHPSNEEPHLGRSNRGSFVSDAAPLQCTRCANTTSCLKTKWSQCPSSVRDQLLTWQIDLDLVLNEFARIGRGVNKQQRGSISIMCSHGEKRLPKLSKVAVNIFLLGDQSFLIFAHLIAFCHAFFDDMVQICRVNSSLCNALVLCCQTLTEHTFIGLFYRALQNCTVLVFEVFGAKVLFMMHACWDIVR